MSQSLENISNLLHESPSLFLLSAFRLDAGKITILFSSVLAAREVAYMLRGDWDGVNAVTIYQPDAVAVQNTLALLKLELGQEEVNYCYAGEDCSVLVLPPLQIFSTARSGKSVLMAEFLMQFSGYKA
ncbi:hypothetical protein [Synechocystis sp. PCC 7509]|uniref:hypothetical protein n=1 Tax=Synechocystis sp. PCC 7509 TaxID=927677 RepID=UPI0002ABAAD5|nr:hypothetical protein [Synechocystis sp. PCC 7509]